MDSSIRNPQSAIRNPPEVHVRACKFDGRVHREWHARLLKQDGNLIVVAGVFNEEVRHPLLGHIVAGTHSTEYYWTDRWYSVFRFREPSGELRNYYCNVNLPAEFDGRTLTFVDLDIDVLVAPDFTYSVLDLDEFERHARLYGYPLHIQEEAHGGLGQLVKLIESRQFPFTEADG
ncbi:MAG: DUF402 domain-containing protein [Pyrinomonadaceae bacterium]